MIRRFMGVTPAFEHKEDIILRDYLALERTRLANERTLLSYIKASLYLLLGGIAFLRLEGFGQVKWIGYVSLGLSVLLIAIGILRFFWRKNRLRRYYANTKVELADKEGKE